jgi:acyl-CoA oxidase
MSSFETIASRLSIYATTSGLMVLILSCGVQDIETARRLMRGHGYSAFAGLGRLYADYLPSVT